MILNENPDTVYLLDDSEKTSRDRNIISWTDEDAVPFLVKDDWAMWSKGPPPQTTPQCWL